MEVAKLLTQYASNKTPYAIRKTPYAIRNTQYAIRNTQYAIRNNTMSKQATRIAMWSGARNISTALMRAWENRSDTVVWDEPFYAHYLHVSGSQHPGRDEIIESYERDWVKVVEAATGAIPHGKSIYYQKYMTHHMLEHIKLDWL